MAYGRKCALLPECDDTVWRISLTMAKLNKCGGDGLRNSMLQ